MFTFFQVLTLASGLDSTRLRGSLHAKESERNEQTDSRAPSSECPRTPRSKERSSSEGFLHKFKKKTFHYEAMFCTNHLYFDGNIWRPTKLLLLKWMSWVGRWGKMNVWPIRVQPLVTAVGWQESFWHHEVNFNSLLRNRKCGEVKRFKYDDDGAWPTNSLYVWKSIPVKNMRCFYSTCLISGLWAPW